jgi:hypothetical protein
MSEGGYVINNTVCTVSLYEIYRPCTINILHAWKLGQNVISLAYDVNLSPFKLCLDHEDDIYVMDPFLRNYEHFEF